MSFVENLKTQIELCEVTNGELITFNKEIEVENIHLFNECSKLTKEYTRISNANIALCDKIEKLEQENNVMSQLQERKSHDLADISKENSILLKQIYELMYEIDKKDKTLKNYEV